MQTMVERMNAATICAWREILLRQLPDMKRLTVGGEILQFGRRGKEQVQVKCILRGGGKAIGNISLNNEGEWIVKVVSSQKSKSLSSEIKQLLDGQVSKMMAG